MLKQKLQEEQIQALKKKQINKLNFLRYILSKIKNKEIDKKRELTDEEIIVIIKKLLKENKETYFYAQKNKNEGLMQKLTEEKNILSAYLPRPLSKKELVDAINKIIKENQQIFNRNPKAIIGICIKNLNTRAEVDEIRNLLKENYGIN
ncbi:MAG: GatB/YqeY domain-containing protein [Microgenomates group bacterium]